MLLNCDLGERETETAPEEATPEALAMPYIHLANIACGFHAGGPKSMRRTLALAARHHVAVGAHPSYPDRAHFGRRSLSLPRQEIIDIIHYQVAALEGMARQLQRPLNHIKPHGALYNDMMTDAQVRDAVLSAVASYSPALPLVMQATPHQDDHRDEAAALGVTVLFEAFADRRYTDAGHLVSRSEPGAVLDHTAMMAQVELLLRDGVIQSENGDRLALAVDTLCVHGDNAAGVQAIAAIRDTVDRL